MEEISKKDLEWLYWGNEEEQIIAKLTNVENKFKQFITNLKKNSNENKIFTNILLELKNEESRIKNEILKNITEKQLQRLYKLNEKYKLIETIELEKQELNDIILKVIKEILNNRNDFESLKQIILKDYSSNKKLDYLHQCQRELKKLNYEISCDKIKEITKEYLINIENNK